MKTRTINIYNFNELSDSAKETARSWYREHCISYDWCEWVYEGAASAADILGIDLRGIAPRRGYKINIGFSGFSSQGDGAHFEGSYRYAKGSQKRIREYAPQDTELHRIADELFKVQSDNLFQLWATVKHIGHYQHENCTSIAVYASDDSYTEDRPVEEAVAKLLRDFMRWIYKQLKKEFNWLDSDEQVDKSILVNEYEFAESGELV